MANAKDILRSLGEHFAVTAGVRSVYGEPVTANGRTVIPVARVGYGFGGGAGGIETAAEQNSLQRGGGGGGGGTGAIPVGVLEITSSGARFVPFTNPWRTAVLVGAAFAAGWVIGRQR